MCDMTHSCVWHDSCIHVAWPIHMCDMTHSYMCNMTHSHVQRQQAARLEYASLRVSRSANAQMCDMTYSHATWLIHMWDLTELCVWHNSLTCATATGSRWEYEGAPARGWSWTNTSILEGNGREPSNTGFFRRICRVLPTCVYVSFDAPESFEYTSASSKETVANL